MDTRRGADLGGFVHTDPPGQQASERVPRNSFPRRAWALVRLSRPLVAGRLLLLVGIAVQLILIYWLGELIDLSVSLMEVWAELARKHLELTLTCVSQFWHR